MKSYTLKLETRVGTLMIENILEFIFAKRYLYYSTMDDKVSRIKRSTIHKAYRLISGSTKWVEVRMRLFKDDNGEK